MKSGLDGIIKQAKEVQDNLQKTRQEIANLEIMGESGAGLVKIVMNEHHDVRRIETNDANKRIKKLSQKKMTILTSSLNLPHGIKLLF